MKTEKKKELEQFEVREEEVVNATKEKMKRSTNFTAQSLKAFSTNVNKLTTSNLLSEEGKLLLKKLNEEIRDNFMRELLNY